MSAPVGSAYPNLKKVSQGMHSRWHIYIYVTKHESILNYMPKPICNLSDSKLIGESGDLRSWRASGVLLQRTTSSGTTRAGGNPRLF